MGTGMVYPNSTHSIPVNNLILDCFYSHYDQLLVEPSRRHYLINPQGCNINLGHNLTIDFPLASLSACHGIIAFHLTIACILYYNPFLLVLWLSSPCLT